MELESQGGEGGIRSLRGQWYNGITQDGQATGRGGGVIFSKQRNYIFLTFYVVKKLISLLPPTT